VYMEVLGEHGWVGLGIFVSLIISSLGKLYYVGFRLPNEQQWEWCRDLARAMIVSLFILMACGCFIGIAFQFPFWYLFGATVSLTEYVRRISQPALIKTNETWIMPPLATEGGNLRRNTSL
jgi:putative inorganic carbon (hco3(-)) transporter